MDKETMRLIYEGALAVIERRKNGGPPLTTAKEGGEVPQHTCDTPKGQVKYVVLDDDAS